MKVEAYQCQYCGQVYLDELGMEYCENSCRIEQEKELKQAESKKQQKDLQESVRLESVSAEDICRRCIEVQNKFAEQDRTSKLVDMQLDVRYSSNASNTHSAPINGISNFSRKQALPAGYPALVGRVKFKYEGGRNNRKSVGGDILRFIHKGTGGGYTLSYHVTLWLDDFPLIKQQVEGYLQEQKRLEVLGQSLESEYQDKVANDGTIQNINKDLESVQEKIYQLQKTKDTLNSRIRQEKGKHSEPLNKTYKEECNSLKGNPFGIQVPYLSL